MLLHIVLRTIWRRLSLWRKRLNGKLDKYLDEGKPAFTTALTEAKEVYENEIATQEEVPAHGRTCWMRWRT